MAEVPDHFIDKGAAGTAELQLILNFEQNARFPDIYYSSVDWKSEIN